MFYAHHAQTISNSWTHLDPTRVFAGQYWDEFGMTAHLVPDGAHVLMLGLARGGGLRPILSSSKKLKITAIDFNPSLVEGCRNQFRKDFPRLDFEAIHMDAANFLSSTSEKFDCIWLDLYSESEYCPLYFDTSFIRSLNEHLKDTGVLMVNAYGLPNQFLPLERSGVQSAHVACLKKEFSHIAAIPYRRNMTIIASKCRPQALSAEPHRDLNFRDSRSFRGMAMRLNHLSSISFIENTVSVDLCLQNINRHMIRLWSEVVHEIRHLGERISSPQDILTLLESPSSGASILSRAIGRSRSVLMTFPILAASEIHLRPLNMAWLYGWLFENADELKFNHPDIYREIWLTQLWASCLHLSETLSIYEERLWALIEKELS